jgi:DNA-binding NtrC family response regulator
VSTLATKLVEGRQARLELDAAELRVVAGPDRGLRVTLSHESLVLGSAADCHVVLHDPTVSARHAEIRIAPPGYTIRDLGSTNGLVCGRHPIERAPITDGMRVQLGDSAIALRATGTRQSVELAGPGRLGDLVAHSVKMRALAATLEPIARSDGTVLIEGETGTGKEVLAQAIHQLSDRRSGPFVIFDCGTANITMVAAELFGHERGAFTGAETARAGLLAEAEGGTLFLDEIGELPLEVQPILLGAIERKRSRPLGGAERAHDVRVLAATNRNLAEEARAGRFRQDLCFRLAALRVRMPPLRERSEDLAILADRFARDAGVELSPELIVLLRAYDWPGNVRELRNLIARLAFEPDAAAALVSSVPVGADGVFEVDGQLRGLAEARRLQTDAFECAYLEQALARTGGNLSQAARLAGLSVRGMQALAAKHGVRTGRQKLP